MAASEVADRGNADAIALASSNCDSSTAEITDLQKLITELGG
jgi:hypothetical protein